MVQFTLRDARQILPADEQLFVATAAAATVVADARFRVDVLATLGTCPSVLLLTNRTGKHDVMICDR